LRDYFMLPRGFAMNKIPTHVVECLDENPAKKFPAGLSSVMYAVQGYWTRLQRGDKRAGPIGAKRFCDAPPAGGGFYATWQSILFRWPGNESLSLSGLQQHLPPLFEQDHELRYSILAAFSAHCGLPTALFLLYSRLVSIEMKHMRDEKTSELSRAELLEFISACKSVLELAERQVSKARIDRPIFNHHYSERKDGRLRGEKRRDKHIAKANMLFQWSKVFQEKGSKFNPFAT
jgi:hypothetical protein